jgi:hypothetical protein
MPVPRKLLQSTYVAVLQEERLVVAYLIGEVDVFFGRKTFGVGKVVVSFFLHLHVKADLLVGPFGASFGEMAVPTNCRSLREQTWAIRKNTSCHIGGS